MHVSRVPVLVFVENPHGIHQEGVYTGRFRARGRKKEVKNPKCERHTIGDGLVEVSMSSGSGVKMKLRNYGASQPGWSTKHITFSPQEELRYHRRYPGTCLGDIL